MFQGNVAALLLCAVVCRGFLGETKTTVGVMSYRGARIGTYWSDSKKGIILYGFALLKLLYFLVRS